MASSKYGQHAKESKSHVESIRAENALDRTQQCLTASSLRVQSDFSFEIGPGAYCQHCGTVKFSTCRLRVKLPPSRSKAGQSTSYASNKQPFTHMVTLSLSQQLKSYWARNWSPFNGF